MPYQSKGTKQQQEIILIQLFTSPIDWTKGTKPSTQPPTAQQAAGILVQTLACPKGAKKKVSRQN